MPKFLQRFNPFTGNIEQRPVYGDQFEEFISQAVSITTSETFQVKLPIQLPVLADGGIYYLDIKYGWNHNATNNDFEARLFDTVAAVALDYLDGYHKQEEKDSAGNWEGTGSSQRHYITRRYRIVGAGVAPNLLQLQWRTDSAGDESSIWDAIAEFKRVG